MSEIVGFNITPDSGTSLRKVLKYNLEAHMERFEAISVAASKVKCIQQPISLSLSLSLSLSHLHVHTCICTCTLSTLLHCPYFLLSSLLSPPINRSSV